MNINLLRFSNYYNNYCTLYNLLRFSNIVNKILLTYFIVLTKGPTIYKPGGGGVFAYWNNLFFSALRAIALFSFTRRGVA